VELGFTQNIFLQGVWGYLLSRYNNTTDVVFGSVVSGRPGELFGVEEMIGLFINTIPVRVRYGGDDTVKDLLLSLQQAFMDGGSHHYLSLSDIQSQSELRNGLIDHIMVFENYAIQDGVEKERDELLSQEESFAIASMDVFEQTNYDFNIKIIPGASSIKIEFDYNGNKYDSALMAVMLDHLDSLIGQFSSTINIPLNSITFLSESEKHELLSTFNDTFFSYPKDKTIVSLFEDQVVRTPDAVAVVFEGVELTYRELNERSNQLAHCLREDYGVLQGDLVGILLDRSEWFVVSMLGVLKSGGAYVPIDPAYPNERVGYFIKDTGVKLLVSTTDYMFA